MSGRGAHIAHHEPAAAPMRSGGRRRPTSSDTHRRLRQGATHGFLTLATFMTLDGIMQAPGGPDEDRDGGFEHGGWGFPISARTWGR